MIMVKLITEPVNKLLITSQKFVVVFKILKALRNEKERSLFSF